MNSRNRMLACLALLLVSLVASDRVETRAADAAALNAATESIHGTAMQQHVNLLASDTLEGREAGSRGGRAAGAFIIEQLKKLKLTGAGDDGSFEQNFGNGYRNILAILPGSDAKLREECILVGAHYDHVGYGSQDNSLGPVGYIHNGADDNASGTAGLLAIVKAFTLLSPAPRRSIVFAFWDGEEKGLLGSEHWIAAPTIPLARIRFAFNIDMIGRLREQRIEVFGVRTAPGLRRLLAEQNRQNALYFEFNWDNIRDSDHYPFYQRRIPFLMMFTRKHDDYHRPSDDAEKINHEGMQQVVRVLFRTVDAIAELEQIPRFRDESTRESQYDQRQSSYALAPEPSRLGVTWDAKAEKNGEFRLVAVDAGSPADRAGLKIGDRLKEFGGYALDGSLDFRSIVLAASSPVDVVVERTGEAKPLTVALELKGKPRRIGMMWRVDSAEPNSVIVNRVDGGSPAAIAGLRVNDRIYSVSGKSFASTAELLTLLATDDPIDMTVEQQGHIRNVRIQPLAPPASEPAVARKPTAEPEHGAR